MGIIKPVKMSLLDRIIREINPEACARRLQMKAATNFLAGGYTTSVTRKNSMRGWFPRSGDADSDTLPKLADMRESSRDLYMNAPLATAAIRRIKTNAVGYGLQFRSSIDREKLGLTDDQANEWEAQCEREFKLWADTPACDITRNQNFYDLQDLVVCSVLLNGDAFILLPQIAEKSIPYRSKIQIIEADDVSNPNFALDTHNIAGGIELDSNGAPRYYHIRQGQSYPYDKLPTWAKVRAFGRRSGRRNVLHLYFKERVGQRRGVPLLAPVIEPLKSITRLSESELNAAILASFFTVFVKHTPGTGGLQSGFVPDDLVSEGDSDEDYVYEMGQGNVIEMDKDQDISIADPKRPNGEFEPFFLSLVKQIGSALEIPFEQLILHFSASYSASRAALLEAWKYYRKVRTWMARNYCQPVYESWLEEAISRGRIVAPGFFIDASIRKAWCGAIWGGPGQGQIDPLKETKASALKINNYLSTHEDEYVAINGGNWDNAFNRIARERDTIRAKDFPYPTSSTKEEEEVDSDNNLNGDGNE